MRILLLGLGLLAAMAVACGGSGEGGLSQNADGLYVIERLDLEDVDLEAADLFEPHVPIRYPDVVVTVNGEEITGDDLFFKQVAQELARREVMPNFVHVVLLRDTGGDPEKPLESIIDERLLNQAILRLDLAPAAADFDASYLEEEVSRMRNVSVLEEIGEDGRFAMAAVVEEIEKVLTFQGLPLEGWADSGPLFETYRMSEGLLALVSSECSPIFPSYERPIRSFCGSYLTAERENAVIEYFVVWAE